MNTNSSFQHSWVIVLIHPVSCLRNNKYMKTWIKTQFKSVINRFFLIYGRILSINIIQGKLNFDIQCLIYIPSANTTFSCKHGEYLRFFWSEEMEDDLYLLHDEDILASLDLYSVVQVSVQDNKIMDRELKVSDMECLSSPETPATVSGAKRFKSVSELELNEFQDSQQTTSTTKNHKLGHSFVSR